MRKILIIALLATTTSIFAQRGDKVKAFKTAHITEALSLTPDEAEKFWPVYNAHEEAIRNLRKSERQMIRSLEDGMDSMSEKEADELLARSMDVRQQLWNEHQALLADLKPILSSKKILLLQKAEEDFKRMLLRRMGDRKKKGGRP